MKKALILALVVILSLSLAVPAAAVYSPVGQGLLASISKEISYETVNEDGSKTIVEPIDFADMTDKEKALMNISEEERAKGTLNMKTVVFDAPVRTKTIATDGTTTEGGKGVMTFTLKERLKPNQTIVARLFDGEKWTTLDVEYDAETGTVVISGIENGRLIIGIEETVEKTK